MLTQKTLRNIPKNVFHPLLQYYEHKNIHNITRGKDGYDYSRFIDFLDEELEVDGTFKNDLDKVIKENLYYNQMSQHYIYNLNSFLKSKNRIKESEIIHILNEEEFNLNQNILDYKCSKTYDICNTSYSTKKVNGVSCLTNLKFLIFLDTLEKREKDFNLFCAIDIDFEAKFITFKFNTHIFEISKDPHGIINSINNLFHDKSSPLSKLEIEAVSHNLSTVRKMIQNIFIELSQQAEDIIKKKLPPYVDCEIKDFIEKFDIDYRQEYKNQIISVIYQDIGSQFTVNDFKDGWVFRFLFKEGDNTRASSRSENTYKHIYDSQIYWNLKDLMFDRKGTEFLEASFLWNVNPHENDIDIGSVSVRIAQNNDDIKLNYYSHKHNSIDRKEKEKVVLQNIRAGLQSG